MATPSCVYKIAEMGLNWIGMKCTVRFNMGIGMILIVDADDVDTVNANLESRNEAVYENWSKYRCRRRSCCRKRGGI